MNLLGAGALREVMARHGVRPSKALGQNFVVDPNTIRKVVAAAGLAADDEVLEIGAGAGSLTLGLAAAARRVVALEKDARLLPVLAEVTAAAANVEVVHADALEAGLDGFGCNVLVANLPYNVAVPVVLRTLETAPRIRRLTVMTQREVGLRLAASPGGKEYGRSTVAVALYGRARVAERVSRHAFWPVPNVESVLVAIDRRAVPDVDLAACRRLVEAAFGQRRKTLRNALTPVLGPAASDVLAAAGIDPDARPEQVAPEGYVALTRAAISLQET